MAEPDRPGEVAPRGARALSVLCQGCGAFLPHRRPGQRFCSGACRAKASRTTKASRMRADLEELQRRLDAMIREL